MSLQSGNEIPEIDFSGVRKNSTSSITLTPTSRFFQLPITMDNVVLRGTKVKNIEFVYGVIVYTGEDSRLAQNSKITHTKFSTVER